MRCQDRSHPSQTRGVSNVLVLVIMISDNDCFFSSVPEHGSHIGVRRRQPEHDCFHCRETGSCSLPESCEYRSYSESMITQSTRMIPCSAECVFTVTALPWRCSVVMAAEAGLDEPRRAGCEKRRTIAG